MPLVARHWHEDDVELERVRAELLVEVVLERLEQFIGKPVLVPPVQEVEGPAVHDQRAQHPALLHAVPVAGEGLQHRCEVVLGASVGSGIGRRRLCASV